MLETFTRIASALGVTGLDFQVTSRQRRQLLWISLVPALVVVALATMLYIDIEYSTIGFLRPEWASRTYGFASAVSRTGMWVALAVLFVAGSRRIARGLASWCFLIAVALAVLAAGFGIAAAGIYLFAIDYRVNTVLGDFPSFTTDFFFNSLEEWRPETWISWSTKFGAFSVGYAFLAHRGLGESARPVRRLRRRA